MPTYPTYKLGDVAEIINGKNQKEVVSLQGEYPIYGSGGIIGRATDYLCKENSTIIGRKGTIDSPIFVNQKFWNVDTAFGIQPSDKILPRYLFFFCKSFDFKKLDKSTTIPSLAKRDLLQIPIPLPPLPTQHQIVSRIESLFAELDKAVEHLRTAQQQLKIYRQAVLNHWLNNENGKWKMVKLGEVAEKIFDGPFGTHLKSDDYVGEGVRVVRLENIKAGFFDDSKQSFVTEEKYETIKRHTVYPSDLIMSTFIAEEVKVCQMPEYIGFAVNKADCIGIRLKPEVSVDYIKYYLSLRSVYHELEIQVHGATRPRVNTTQIKNIKISLPPLPEQQRIVEEIETRLSQAEAAEARIAEALQKTEALRQSILKKAFSGELV